MSGSHEPLTLLAIISLVAAFPTTIAYILIHGSEPFPDSLGAVITNPQVAAIMQFYYVIPGVLGIILGTNAPWYLTLGTWVLSGLIFFYNGGIRDLDSIPLSTTEDKALMIVGAAPIAWMLLQLLGAAGAQQNQFILGDIGKGVISVIGIVILIMASIAKASDTPPDADVTAEHIFLSLPKIFSVLQASFIRNSPLAPASLIFGVASTLVGCMGGAFAMAAEADN